MRATGGELTERRNSSSFPACDWRECYDVTRAELFTRESNRHPAKMAVGLCFKIFQHGQARGYWKPGDCILDPMAGIFTTGVCGAVLGYRVLGVELEPHFIELAEGNIEFSRSKWHPKGDAVIVRGDARNLTGTVSGAVSSPPYSDSGLGREVCAKIRSLALAGKWDDAIAAYRIVEEEQVRRGQKFSVSKNLRERLERALAAEDGYSGAVASPPYADAQITGVGHFRSKREPNCGDAATNPREGYAGAVNSPPYPMPGGGAKGIAVNGYTSRPDLGPDWIGDRSYQPRTHGTSPGQIGNLRDPAGDIDAVLSSPPYGNQMSRARARARGPRGWKIIAEKKIEHNCYGDTHGQIGNANDETYLSAMFQVYSELHRVLRPGGVVALVTKNPVKNKQIRRLDLDTITLMERAGFSLIERFRAMLTRETQHGHLFGGETIQRTERKSFFKRLYERKNPGLRVDWEDVLIFRSRR